MSGDVALGVRLDDRLVAVHADRHRLLHRTHVGMARLDAAVQDAHAHARTRRTAPCPVPGDVLGPVARERNPVNRVGRQAPGRKRLAHGRSV